VSNRDLMANPSPKSGPGQNARKFPSLSQESNPRSRPLAKNLGLFMDEKSIKRHVFQIKGFHDFDGYCSNRSNATAGGWCACPTATISHTAGARQERIATGKRGTGLWRAQGPAPSLHVRVVTVTLTPSSLLFSTGRRKLVCPTTVTGWPSPQKPFRCRG
jgi:hypothetical protein